MSNFYIFPLAVLVCIAANIGGFSGSILFQPFFNFVIGLPITQAIATGIATETIGMTSSSIGHWTANSGTDFKATRFVFMYVLLGIILGLFVFTTLPKDIIRLNVGISMFVVAARQMYLMTKVDSFGKKANLSYLSSIYSRIMQVYAGFGSASTGTGVAEIHQGMFQESGLGVKQANATAILLEAMADITISLFNLHLGNIRFDILIWSGLGVLIGGQLGPRITKRVPAAIGKVILTGAVFFIGVIYVVTSLNSLSY